MTTDEFPTEDPISEDQAQLDVDQSLESVAQYATTDDMQRLVEAVTSLSGTVDQQQRMLSGVTGKIDSGLNAIRRDTQAAAIIDRRREREAVIDGLNIEPEEAQRLRASFQSESNAVDSILDQQQQMAQSAQQSAQQPAQQQPAQQQPTANQDVRRMVAEYGVDPNTPGINYGALTDSSLRELDRLRVFQASVEAVKNSSAAPVAPQQRQRVEREANPPVEPGNAQATSFNSEEEVLDAYITGRINREERDQRLKSVGSGVEFRPR